MRHKYSPKRNRDIFVKELKTNFNQPINRLLHKLHWIDELPLLQMAKKLKTSRQTITRLMDDYKIPRRSISEDNLRRFKNMPLEKRKVYTKAANETMKGRKTPVIERNKRAKTLQKICKLSNSEKSFYQFLKDNNLNPIPLYAIAIFNIDFAFPKQKIAIEVDGGNWHQTPTHQTCQKRKENYLAKQGWKVLRVRFSKDKWYPSKNSFVKRLSELFKERASTQPL